MVTVLELYERLKPKLGEEEARALLEFVETSVDRKAATKEDLQRTESALKQEIQSVKVDMLKWTFGFWAGAIAVLSGVMLALLRSYAPK